MMINALMNLHDVALLLGYMGYAHAPKTNNQLLLYSREIDTEKLKKPHLSNLLSKKS
ncbi:hypothetical protein ACQJBY_016284 [Aegilops geniculata]